jgi:DNA transformation protein
MYMPLADAERKFTAYVVALMESLGPVSSRAMFGGYGIFLDGLMFALVADSVLYLKVDQESEPEFRARGLEAFAYNKKGKTMKMSYCQAPEETLEDSEAMVHWGRKAYEAALRAAAKKKKGGK